MINRVVLVGRLTKDVELKYTQSGIAVARFTLAVNRAFKSADGEQQADFINCVAWRKQAENVANYLRKGSLAGVDGRITTGSFEGQDGKRVFTVEVTADSTQFLEPKSNRSEQPNSSQQAPQQTQSYGQANTQPSYQAGQGGHAGQSRHDDPFNNSSGPIEVTDDDLPF